MMQQNTVPLVLIVDDQEANRSLLEGQMEILGYRHLSVTNGLAALSAIENIQPDVVLLDMMMPEMDGFGVLEHLHKKGHDLDIPVIVISAVSEIDSIARCLELGADDYMTKPFNLSLLEARIKSCLEKKRMFDAKERYRLQIEEYNAKLQREVDRQVEKISSIQLSAIYAMSKLAESRDPETGEHIDRMRLYCRKIAERLVEKDVYADQMDEDFILNLFNAAPLHDIGKVGIPDRILLKPERLTADEFEIMKKHAEIGAKTLHAVERQHPGNTFIRIGMEVAWSHHERWDGSGYPRALSGESIPLAGRILALGDVYDALTSKRCYKEAISHERAHQIICSEAGTHFDPRVIECFDEINDEFENIRVSVQDSEKVMVK